MRRLCCIYGKLLQAHFLTNLAEAFHCEVQIFLGVTGRNLGADAILALGHDGVAEGDNVYALLQHPAG